MTYIQNRIIETNIKSNFHIEYKVEKTMINQIIEKIG